MVTDNKEATEPRVPSLKSLFYGHNHDLVNRYEISVSQMTMDMFRLW